MFEMLMYYIFVWGRFLFIAAIFAAAVIGMMYFFFKRPKVDEEGVESVVTSKDLLRDVNEEREKQGLHEIPAINSRSAGTGNYARHDKSFSSVPDFFIKLFGKGKKNG